ncbi:DUF7168 domain-containing protein [Bradyrhizobium sp. USDA 3364]
MADRDSIIEKIKALLLKTRENGCTEEEELSALAKARAWIDAHEITDDELQLGREEKAILHNESEADARDTHKIKWQLAFAVSQYCNVRIYRDHTRVGLTFAGFKSDIAFATWLLEHLSNFVHDALFEFLLDCLAPDGKERKAEIRGFVIGCTGRLTDRLIKMCDQSRTERTTNGNALVVAKDQAIKDLLKAEGICLRSSSHSCAGFSDSAMAAGQSAGDRASFGRPVSGADATLRLGKS